MKRFNKVKLVWLCIIICFLLIGSPLILLLNKTDSVFFGVPLLYGFVFFIWLLLCVLTFIGYRLRWGQKDDEK